MISAEYSKGYNAGRKKTAADLEKQELAQATRLDIRHQLWRNAFASALTARVTVQGWKQGEKSMNSIVDRTALAADFADAAVFEASKRGKII